MCCAKDSRSGESLRDIHRPMIVVPDDEPSILIGTEPEMALQRLGKLVVHSCDCTRALSEEELVKRVASAEIVLNIRGTSVFSKDVLNECSRLKMISVYGVGYNNVDTATAARLGIIVTNTPGYSANVVAEMALSLMLAVARNVARNDRLVRSGSWERTNSAQLFGKTLGVVGTGNIGRRMIQLGKGIGMDVIAWTAHPSHDRARQYDTEFVSMEDLMRRSDVVSIHVIGGSETVNLIDDRLLRLMKPSAILVNTARGSVLDEAALIAALRDGVLAGAGLDVFTVEPLLSSPLKSMENVVLSPHTAAMTAEATILGLTMAVDNIAHFLTGAPVNVVA